MSVRAAIEQEGFEILPAIFSPESIDHFLREIEKLSPRRSRAGIRHALAFEPVASLARHPSLMRIASGVLGPSAFPFRATVFDKSPQSNWLVVWHQDTALPIRARSDVEGWGPWSVKEGIAYAHAPGATLEHVLALRVSLDDSTLENGPLKVLPGTHKLGVLTDDAIHELSLRHEAVDCVVSKGAVLAMRPLIVHASSKSRSQISRRVLHIEYAASASIAAPLVLAVA
ncbi:MAG TPA: phytanoyl-CoA dioxygenase family protein [Candidatus Solibacter sp.]|nr:phytanoyl-CoA dioxygenase family protein [Candidatus Solibacter sp.]